MKKIYEFESQIDMTWCQPYVNDDNDDEWLIISEGEVVRFHHNGKDYYLPPMDEEQIKSDVDVLNEMLSDGSGEPAVVIDEQIYTSVRLTGDHDLSKFHTVFCNQCPCRDECDAMCVECSGQCEHCQYWNESEEKCRAAEDDI